MRILMLTQWFQPESFVKGLPFAKELCRRGHQVEILTGFPNYPEGKIYEGYSITPWKREVMDGITVNRVALYPNHSQSGLLRIFNYLSFSLMALIVGPWLIHKKPDVIYVFNLPTLSRPASFIRWLRGCKIVYDVQDLWPESVASSNMLPFFSIFHIFLKKWCLNAYQRSDHIVVQSLGFKNNLIQRGIEKEKIEVIYNWNLESVDHPEPGVKELTSIMKPDHENTFNVVFAGTMGAVQALETVLEAAKLLSKHKQIRFFMIGSGVKKRNLQELSKKMELDNVFFVPRQPKKNMGAIYKMSDVLLVHLRKDPVFKVTIPSKTQAYLAAGKPIIMAVEGDAASLVKQAGAGYTCIPEDSRAMATCVRKLVNMPLNQRNSLGENGKKFYRSELSFMRGVDQFESVFHKTLKETNG